MKRFGNEVLIPNRGGISGLNKHLAVSGETNIGCYSLHIWLANNFLCLIHECQQGLESHLDVVGRQQPETIDGKISDAFYSINIIRMDYNYQSDNWNLITAYLGAQC